MAGVLIDQAVATLPHVFAAPRRGPGGRIVDCEVVEQITALEQSESLDEVQVLVAAVEARLLAKICGLDDQNIAFPAPDGVSQPPPVLGGPVLS